MSSGPSAKLKTFQGSAPERDGGLIKRIDGNLRVILIGGSFNVGKSTVAGTIAQKLSWRCVSTDSLAKHPGRPWPNKREKVRDNVLEHYQNQKANELVESVILHQRRMSPLIAELVRSTAKAAGTGNLVLEGGALWPFITGGYRPKEVAAIWLTAGVETLRARIQKTSGFLTADQKGKAMISMVIERTLLFEEKTAQLVSDHGCPVLNVDKFDTTEQLIAEVLSNLESAASQRRKN